uniref:EB domain-containing protein n=1 Tax=Graphocephala atropunctata TaxID=36148 RepID=A0A1B6MM11_9HEMI
MASQRVLYVLGWLVLVAAARAQEADVAVQNVTETPVQPSQPPAETATEIPVQAATSAPVPEVTEKSAEVVTAASAQPEVEDPLLAAKKVEGSPELDQTAIFEPDAINKVPVGLGDECEEEAQCDRVVPNSDCRDNKCTCPHNHIFDTGRCWERQMLGGNCNISLQCDNVEFATCAQGVCTCVDPYIPSPVNKCLQPAGDVYRAPCVEDIQCTHSYGDEARCSNNMCRCTNNYHFNGTTCIADKKLGEICEVHEDCAVSDEGSRMCQDNNCTCAEGYKTLPGEEICTKSSGEELAVSLTWILCIVVAKYYLA